MKRKKGLDDIQMEKYQLELPNNQKVFDPEHSIESQKKLSKNLAKRLKAKQYQMKPGRN